MTSSEKGKPESGEPGGVEISKRLLLVNSVSTVLMRLMTLVIVVWMHQYLIRRIPTEEYAIYPVVLSVMAFTPIMTSVLTGGIARYVVHAYARHDTHRVSQIVTSVSPRIAVAAIALWSAGAVAAHLIGSLLSVDPSVLDDAQLMMFLIVTIQALELLLFPFSLGLYVRQRFVLTNLILLFEELVRIPLTVVLLLGVSPRSLWIVVAMFVSRVPRLLATLAISQRLVPSLRFRLGLFDGSTARRLLSFGSWTAIGGVAHRLGTHADPIILNLLSTPFEVTIFNIGSLPAQRLSNIINMASDPLQPMITAMHAKGDSAGLQRAYLRGNRIILWAVLLPCVPLMVLGAPLSVLYVGDAYVRAGVVMLWVSLSLCLGRSAEMLYRVAVASARVRGFFLTAIAGSILNVGLTVVLVGHFDLGATGAAIATIVMTIASRPILWWMGNRMVEISFARFWRETLWPAILPAVVAAGVCWVLNLLVAPNTWLELGLCAGAGMVAYLAALLLFGLQPADRRDLASLLRSARNRLSVRAT